MQIVQQAKQAGPGSTPYEMTSAIMADAAERGTTVVISSHILAELEPVCDHLIMIGAGQVRLAGDVDELVGLHTVVTGACEDGAGLPRELKWHTVIGARAVGRAAVARAPHVVPAVDRLRGVDLLLSAHSRRETVRLVLGDRTDRSSHRARLRISAGSPRREWMHR